MDVFTQRALAVSQGPAWRLEMDVDSATPAEKGPVALDERIALAYAGAIPPAVARFFSWKMNLHATAFDGSVSLSWETKSIVEQMDSREKALQRRIPEVRQRLAELMARLPALRAEYAQICRQLEADPPLDASPQDVGQVAITKAGCERLIPAIEREIERMSSELARLKMEKENWGTLGHLAGVIAGLRKPTDSLARDLGFEFAWQLCDPWQRAKREKEHAEELERKRAVALQWEEGRAERERQAAELAEVERAKAVEEARFEALGLEGLVGIIFFGSQEFTLGQIKERVAQWDELRTLKEAIRLWPEADPDLWIAARRDVSGWLERRRLDPAWRPSAEEDLISRAARRLARLVHPNPQTPNVLR